MFPIYAREPLPTKMVKSIFLAGPTPRSSETLSWRREALEVLESLGYDGHVFIPEPAGGWSSDYDGQIEWEDQALNQADLIVFWLPRDLETLPGFTTNDEWGVWKNSGKVMFGAPEGAAKVRYQQYYAEKCRVPQYDSLRGLLRATITRLGPGRLRQEGEVQVPLYVWEQPSFQSWYSYQQHAGNVLKAAEVLWTFRVGPKLDKMFCWVLKVSVYITSESRVKSNEFVLGRPDISTVVLWHRAASIGDTRVVLIKEFRSPARTLDGFVREVPGGSAKLGTVTTDPMHVAIEELREETGFKIERSRLQDHSLRQVFGTLSSVGAFVYSAEITAEEIQFFEAQAGQARGVEADSERTFTEVHRVGDLMAQPVTDWATLGMIFAALTQH
jgi:8-oxo-dGTP pyrophosphatase MutT (NUDIX family)